MSFNASSAVFVLDAFFCFKGQSNVDYSGILILFEYI